MLALDTQEKKDLFEFWKKSFSHGPGYHIARFTLAAREILRKNGLNTTAEGIHENPQPSSSTLSDSITRQPTVPASVFDIGSR